MEDGAQEFELFVGVSQSITVGQIKLFTVYFGGKRFTVNDDSALLSQVVATPEIVISWKKCTSTPMSVSSESFPKKRV